MNCSDLPLRCNTWNAVSNSGMLRPTTQGIYSDEYKNPFEMVRVALSSLCEGQRAVVQLLKDHLAVAATPVVSQQISTQLSQAEQALAKYEGELNKAAQLCHQLITKILDTIR